MFNAKTILAAAGLLAASAVDAHMQLVTPQGHSFLTNDGLNSPGRPLDATGSDFPCRNPSLGLAWTGPTNSYALGSKQQLALKGSAVHGGGSCQLSISYDTAPTEKSVFKVIHTVQGGCPARSTTGNLGDDAEMTDPFTYDYTIPSDIPAGNATIAWSWINRVGNREFYMNCGVLELTGTGGDQANFDKLPDLFVANIDGVSSGCSTSPSGQDSSDFDPVIPNAGDSVEDNLSLAAAGGWTTRVFDSATCASASSGYAATTGSGSGATSIAASATSVAVATSAAASATASVPGGVFITKTTQAAATSVAQVTSVAPIATSAPAVSASASAAPSATASAGTGSSSGSVKSGSCDVAGTFYCAADGKSFQQCASGTWSVSTQMAAGTVCTPGESTDMKIAAAGRRMAMRALKV